MLKLENNVIYLEEPLTIDDLKKIPRPADGEQFQLDLNKIKSLKSIILEKLLDLLTSSQEYVISHITNELKEILDLIDLEQRINYGPK
jgi:hypothetical protein